MTVAVVAHEIDSLYDHFLVSKGEATVNIANEILAMAGDTTRFTMETSTDEINGKLLKTMIYFHFDRVELSEVINYAQRSIGFYEQIEDWYNLAGCYNTIGVAYQRMGKMEEAIDSYNLCNEVLMKMNEKEGSPIYEKNIRYTTNNMAAIYSSMGEYDMAEDMFSNCINMLGTPQDDVEFRDMATYLQNLADVYLSQAEALEGRRREEKIEQAVSLAEQALDFSLEHNDRPTKIIQRMMVVSRAYFADNRAEEATKLLEEAQAFAETENDSFLLTEIELLFGRYQCETQHYKDAEQHFQKAIAMAREDDLVECLLNAYKGAYEASRHFDLEKALGYYEQSVNLKDSIFNGNQQMLVRDYQVKYALAEKEHQLAIEQENNKWKSKEILALVILSGLLLVLLIILVSLIRVRKKQNETLARLNETQNRILSVASHDVKTSVLAQNMVLKLVNEHFDNMSSDELKEKLAMLKTGSDDLKDKLYNILHWIYGELGKEVNLPENFNLLSLVESGLRPHVEELKAKDLMVVKDIAPGLTCFDQVNVFNIVFQNLISNAIKFSLQGGEIEVRAIEEDSLVWVEVADHGVGISEDRLRELMYDKVMPSEGTQGERGTGIGLFVSRQLMVKNGGQLLIESKEGEGTTIRFNLKKPKQ